MVDWERIARCYVPTCLTCGAVAVAKDRSSGNCVCAVCKQHDAILLPESELLAQIEGEASGEGHDALMRGMPSLAMLLADVLPRR